MVKSEIKKRVEQGLMNNLGVDKIKQSLLKEGYSSTEVNESIAKIASSLDSQKNKISNKSLSNRKFFLDRIGFGFASTQFINILFHLTGASFFFIGFVNILKSSITGLFSSFFKQYSKKNSLKSSIINIAGLIFGFSFLFIALAVYLSSPDLFAISVLLGSIGIVIYGDLYRKYQSEHSHNEGFLNMKTVFVGILVTTISLFASAILMDLIPIAGKSFTLNILENSMDFRLHGFLISFEITAVAFILSSYALSKMTLSNTGDSYSVKSFFFDYYDIILRKGKRFLSNKYLFVLSLATLFLAVFQAIIYTFAGIYIFTTFNDSWLHGFSNIAMVFGLPILFSLIGPLFSTKLHKYLGLTPLMVFGTILLAIFPLTLAYNLFFPAIVVASIVGVLGNSIIGTAQGLVTSRLLNKDQRDTFYQYSGVLTIIPFFIIGIIIISFVSLLGLQNVFKILGFGIIILLLPLFLLLVFWSTKKPIGYA